MAYYNGHSLFLLSVPFLTLFTPSSPALSSFLSGKANYKASKINSRKLDSLVSSDGGVAAYKKLLTPLLRTRVPDTDGSYIARKHIEAVMKDLKWSVEFDGFQSRTPFGLKHFYNIIATLNPNAPRRLVLACHYDSKYFSQFQFIGATDSAASCAMMMHIATQLNQSLWDNNKFDSQLTLQLIFFDGEEAFVEWTNADSIYGARHLAQKWKNLPHWLNACSSAATCNQGTASTNDLNNGPTVLDSIDILILFDLLGATYPRIRSFFQTTDKWFIRIADIERRLSQAKKIKGTGSPYFFSSDYYRPMSHDQAIRYGIQDDHIPFAKEKVDVLHIIPHQFPHVWHKESDNENALNYDTIMDFCNIFKIFVYEYLHLSSS